MFSVRARLRAIACAATVVACVAATREARAELRTTVDCYLAVGPVECQPLRDGLFASLPFLKTVSERPAVTIAIRSYELDRNFKYVFTFTGTGNRPSFQLVELGVTKTTSADGALTLLEADLGKGLAPYLTAVTAATTEDGVTTLLLRDPVARKDDSDSSTRWYLKLGASGSIVTGTTSTLAAGGNGELNYSGEGLRFNLSTLVNFNHVAVQYGVNQEESQDATLIKGRGIFAKNLSERWSVAAVGTGADDTRNNLLVDAKGEGGIEWDLVPILATNDHSFGVRYLIGVEWQKYVAPTVLATDRMMFVEHSVNLSLTWHFTDFDILGDVAASSLIDDYRYADVSSDLSLLWRLTDRFSISLTGTAAYRNRIIYEPAIAPTDPLSQLVAGGDYRPFTYSALLGFEFTFGNAALNRQDQRWRMSLGSASADDTSPH